MKVKLGWGREVSLGDGSNVWLGVGVKLLPAIAEITWVFVGVGELDRPIP